MKKNYSAQFDHSTINWNNTISNLRGLSNEKVLQLTKRHDVPEF